MGIYVYTMRAKQTNVVIDNNVMPANLLAYSFKPDHSWDGNPHQDRLLARAESFWSKRQTPDVFVIGDKFENGCMVRKGWPDGWSNTYDDEWPGEHLGYLLKVGKRWTIVQEETC